MKTTIIIPGVLSELCKHKKSSVHPPMRIQGMAGTDIIKQPFMYGTSLLILKLVLKILNTGLQFY